MFDPVETETDCTGPMQSQSTSSEKKKTKKKIQRESPAVKVKSLREWSPWLPTLRIVQRLTSWKQGREADGGSSLSFISDAILRELLTERTRPTRLPTLATPKIHQKERKKILILRSSDPAIPCANQHVTVLRGVHN